MFNFSLDKHFHALVCGFFFNEVHPKADNVVGKCKVCSGLPHDGQSVTGIHHAVTAVNVLRTLYKMTLQQTS